jgi:hypothetical protein
MKDAKKWRPVTDDKPRETAQRRSAKLECSGEFISPGGGIKPPLREMRALLEHLTQLAHFAIRALER